MTSIKQLALLPLALIAVVLIYPLGLPYYLNAIVSGVMITLLWGLFDQDINKIEVGFIFFIIGFILLFYAIYISNQHHISLELLNHNTLKLPRNLSNLPFVGIALLTSGTLIIIKVITKSLTHHSSGTG